MFPFSHPENTARILEVCRSFGIELSGTVQQMVLLESCNRIPAEP
jgi:hypothetical protein